MKDKRSLEQFADDKAKGQFAANQEIARQNRVLRAEVEKQEKEIDGITKKLGLYEALDQAPIVPPEWLSPKKPAKDHTAIPCMMLTDVHWDEVVKPEQVDYLNKYTREIAEMRVRRAFKRAIHVTRDYMAGVNYTGFQLF